MVLIMKKMFVLLACLILIVSFALAKNPQGEQQIGDLDDPGVKGAEQGEGSGLMILDVDEDLENDDAGEGENTGENQGKQVKAKNTSELKQMIQQRQQEMEQERTRAGGIEGKVFQNQNSVRLAVHSLLAMEDLVGGIGPQVRLVAREFNNSVQATIKAEEKIQKRSKIKKFFLGGDEEAAAELESELESNKLRIQQLKQLKDECECSSEVKELFMEQVQNMELEQERLGELAKEEKDSRGLFGWMFR